MMSSERRRSASGPVEIGDLELLERARSASKWRGVSRLRDDGDTTGYSSSKAHARLAQYPRAEVDYV